MNSYISDFTGQEYSKTEFVDLILKRVKKDLRRNNSLDMKKEYWIKPSGLKSQIVKKILNDIFQGRLNIIDKDEGELNSKLSCEYLEEYISKRTEVFFKGKEIKNLKKDSIQILRSITYNELKQLKEIYEIDGEIKNKNNVFIEDLQKKYNQTKTSMLKSFINLEHLF